MQTYWVVCHKSDDTPVLPMDSNEPEYKEEAADPGMLVYRTEAGAEAAAEHQNNLWDVDCHAIKLGDEKPHLL